MEIKANSMKMIGSHLDFFIEINSQEEKKEQDYPEFPRSGLSCTKMLTLQPSGQLGGARGIIIHSWNSWFRAA